MSRRVFESLFMKMHRRAGLQFHRCVRRMVLLLALTSPLAVGANDVADLELPPGYSISVYAEKVTNAREMALAPSGVLFVGSRDAGLVHAVVDRDGDGQAEQIRVIARGLNMPSGVAFRDGALYVAEVHRILRFDDIEARIDDPPVPVVVSDRLPRKTHHGWKFIAFGPDGRLYVPVGAPCNVCEVEAPFASILSMQPDGTDVVVYARGIRNSVGFDWHPVTGELWFSDNGRDWLGDDLPPGEINRAPRAGLHFGFPHFHGGDIRDPEFGGGHDSAQFVAPALRLGAHVAPLGVLFYRGGMFAHDDGQPLFVAEHGSWNRSRKAGYRVMRAIIGDDGMVKHYEPFVSGWLRGQNHWGRPVAFAEMPDGSLLISDDYADRIYRVIYTRP